MPHDHENPTHDTTDKNEETQGAVEQSLHRILARAQAVLRTLTGRHSGQEQRERDRHTLRREIAVAGALSKQLIKARWPEWIMAFSGTASLAVVLWHYFVMRDTLVEMREQRSVMSAQMWASIGTNVLAYGQLGAMNDQNKALIDQTALTASQLKITEQQLAEAREERRAWLSVLGGELENFGPEKYFSANIPIHNSGRTPGRFRFIAFEPFIRRDDDETGKSVATGETLEQTMLRLEQGVDEELAKYRHSGVVAPDSASTFFADERVTTLKADYDGVMESTRTLFLCGVLGYDDASGVRRKTWFCFEYNPVRGTLTNYKHHNDMN